MMKILRNPLTLALVAANGLLLAIGATSAAASPVNDVSMEIKDCQGRFTGPGQFEYFCEPWFQQGCTDPSQCGLN